MHALNNLILFFNSSSSGDVYYSVAEVLLQSMDSILGGTIYDWAQLCHVSTATISRFCRKLGYKGFQEFKLELEASIQNYNILNRYAPINLIENYENEEQAYLSMLHENIGGFCNTVDLIKIDALAGLIHEHNPIRIYTHGVSLNEMSLQANLIMSGLKAKSIASAFLQITDIKTLSLGSLAILTLPNVHERTLSLDLLHALKQHEVFIMVLTNSSHSSFLSYADAAYAFDGSMTQLDDYHFSMLLSLLSISYRRKFLSTVQSKLH